MGRERSPDLDRQLADFRERYPVDDRASDFLEKVSPEVLATVIAEFKPRREGETNYSALLTNFVRSVEARIRRRGAAGRRRNPRERGRASSSSPEAERERPKTRRRRVSSEKSRSLDSFGRKRPALEPATRRADSESSSVPPVDVKLPESADLESARASLAAEQEELAGIETEARDDERLKIAKAEDDAQREVEDALVTAKERAQQTFESRLREYEKRLHIEMENELEEERREAEKAARARVQSIQREARQERENRMRDKQDAVARAQWVVRQLEKKAETAAKLKRKAVERAKQNLSSSSEETKRRAVERKEKLKEQEREKERAQAAKHAALSDGDSDAEWRRRRHAKEQQSRSENGHAQGRGRDRDRHRGESCSQDSRRDRYHRSRSPPRERGGRSDGGHLQEDLQDFRDRYPVDDRAFGVLLSATSDVQQAVLEQFRPKREGESDYSALVASFVRKVEKTQASGAAPRRFGEERGERGGTSSLDDFRARYPMDDRAFGVLERAVPAVQATILADFRPRREGEDDYSALVMGFLRSIESRTGNGPRGGRGGNRRDNDRDDSQSADDSR